MASNLWYGYMLSSDALGVLACCTKASHRTIQIAAIMESGSVVANRPKLSQGNIQTALGSVWDLNIQDGGISMKVKIWKLILM